MKYLIVILSAFSLLFLLHCQLEKIPPVVKTFKMPVKVSDVNTSLVGIYQRSRLDSNYLVAMTSPSGLVTVLLSEEGVKTENIKTYQNVKGGIVEALPDEDDGLFLIGEQNAPILTNSKPFFVHIKRDLSSNNPLELKMGPDDPQRSNVYDAVKASNGNVMICGSYFIENIGYNIGITEVDVTEKISPGFPTSLEKSGHVGSGIVEKSDGGFLITANCYTSLFGPHCGSCILSLSKSGITASWWNTGCTDWPYQNNLSAIEKIGGNLFAIYNTGYIACIDKDFNIKWDTIGSYGIKKIIKTSDDNILVLGKVENKIHLTKRSAATGDVIWSESYSESSGTIEAVTVSETLDHGFIIGGNYIKDGKTDIYVIKTDENGKVYE